jgi:hypothetical protein
MDSIKWFWWLLIGAVLMFIILKVLSKRTDNGDTWLYSKQLLTSQQFRNLTRTNEFRELAKTPAFTKLVESLAADQITSVSQSLFQ